MKWRFVHLCTMQNVVNHLASKMKNYLAGFQRLAIGLACIAGIVLGLYLAYFEKVSAASACFTAGIILFLLSNIELFESIKAPGIQATMRKIDDKVREVEELADKVAKASTVTAEFCMQVMARIGRLSGPIPRGQALKLVEDMSEQLRSLNVDPSKIGDLLQPWHLLVIYELYSPAQNCMHTFLANLHAENEQIREKINIPINMNDPIYLEFTKKNREIGSWKEELDRASRIGGKDAVKALAKVFAGISAWHGAPIELHEEISLSLKHAQYYVENYRFLDTEYWISGGGKLGRG